MTILTHKAASAAVAQAIKQVKSGTGVRKTGIQYEVLALYRSFMRLARRKADARARTAVVAEIRHEFRSRQQWPARDFESIEHFIVQGKRRLALFQQLPVSIVAFPPRS
jgi:hypothetical protein